MDKPRLRFSIRKWSMRAAFLLVLFVASTIFGSFITAYGAEQGWFDHPSATVAALIAFFTAILDHDGFRSLRQ